jgi:hypothetical protein
MLFHLFFDQKYLGLFHLEPLRYRVDLVLVTDLVGLFMSPSPGNGALEVLEPHVDSALRTNIQRRVSSKTVDAWDEIAMGTTNRDLDAPVFLLLDDCS